MALEKVIETDRIEVIYPNGEATLQVRCKVSVLEDGVEISSKFHRSIVKADSDLSEVTCPRVRTLAKALIPAHADITV